MRKMNKTILRAECFEIQPKDRDYNKKGKKREPRIEVLGGGVSYALRTSHSYGLMIWEEENELNEK